MRISVQAHGWQPVGFRTAEPTGCHPWAFPEGSFITASFD